MPHTTEREIWAVFACSRLNQHYLRRYRGQIRDRGDTGRCMRYVAGRNGLGTAGTSRFGPLFLTVRQRCSGRINRTIHQYSSGSPGRGQVSARPAPAGSTEYLSSSANTHSSAPARDRFESVRVPVKGTRMYPDMNHNEYLLMRHRSDHRGGVCQPVWQQWRIAPRARPPAGRPVARGLVRTRQSDACQLMLLDKQKWLRNAHGPALAGLKSHGAEAVAVSGTGHQEDCWRITVRLPLRHRLWLKCRSSSHRNGRHRSPLLESAAWADEIVVVDRQHRPDMKSPRVGRAGAQTQTARATGPKRTALSTGRTGLVLSLMTSGSRPEWAEIERTLGPPVTRGLRDAPPVGFLRALPASIGWWPVTSIAFPARAERFSEDHMHDG